jgi:hypothetical protein
MKSNHNTNASPLCRLPDEIIVHIIRLSQSRRDPLAMKRVAPDNSWTRIMLTCTRLRTLLVQTPSLWSFIDIAWNRRWVEICLARSADYQLETILSDIIAMDEDVASALLLRSRTTSVFIGSQLIEASPVAAMLRRPGLQLQSLHYNAGRSTLDSRILGGHSPYLVHLKAEDTLIDGLPDLPKLRYLGFFRSLWSVENRLADQLARHTPQLQELEIADMQLSDFVPWDDRTPSPPVTLPCLDTATVSGDLEIVQFLLTAMPVPLRSLELDAKAWGVDHEGPRRAALMAYVERFWHREREADAPFPPGELSVRHEPGRLPYEYDFEMESEEEEAVMRTMLVCFGTDQLEPDDSILRHVTQLDIHSTEDALYLSEPHAWPIVDRLPKLQDLTVSPTTWDASKIGVLQAWADRHAAMGFGPVRAALWHLAHGQRGRRFLEWDTTDGRLQDKKWARVYEPGLDVDDLETKYMEAVDGDSDDDSDSDDDGDSEEDVNDDP